MLRIDSSDGYACNGKGKKGKVQKAENSLLHAIQLKTSLPKNRKEERKSNMYMNVIYIYIPAALSLLESTLIKGLRKTPHISHADIVFSLS